MLEWHTGQPFSIIDDQGSVSGTVNSYRYPEYLELNTHLERTFTAWGRRWAFRFGFNNVLDRKNPNVVINTIGSPRFMNFFGGQRRAFNLRIRVLGRA
jgi:hypothetical protein